MHNEKLHDLYCSPYRPVIRGVESRKMRLAGHVARMGERRQVY